VAELKFSALYVEEEAVWVGEDRKEEPRPDEKEESSLSKSERAERPPSPPSPEERPPEGEKEENSLSMSDRVERIPRPDPRPRGSLSLPRADGYTVEAAALL